MHIRKTYASRAGDRHRWYYVSEQKPEEVPSNVHKTRIIRRAM